MTENQFQPRRSRWFTRHLAADQEREAAEQFCRDRAALIVAGLREPLSAIRPVALDTRGHPTSRFTKAGAERLRRQQAAP